jgi:hypothetical protein
MQRSGVDSVDGAVHTAEHIDVVTRSPLRTWSTDDLLAAARYLSLTGLLVGVVGLAGRWLAWPLLTSTVGPTAYLFASHPRTEPARFRNAAVGHAVAIGVGLSAMAIFGLLHHPSVSLVGTPSWSQVFASGIAVGATMAVLELLHSHHAPAAATALLITTGLARPGTPLIGLVVGLAIVIALGPLCGRWPVITPTGEVATTTRGRSTVRGDLPVGDRPAS